METLPSRESAAPEAAHPGTVSPAASVRFETSPARRPRIIVLGNEKGGSGKSTTAMHVMVSLLRRGLKVGCLDLDARQGTLSRYVENRRGFAESSGLPLALPEVRRLHRSERDTRSEAEAEEREIFEEALAALGACDYLIVDTPGSDSHLSRLGHTRADILITPLNDSFVDLDLLARIDSEGRKVLGPSIYSQMVWEQRQRRAREGRPPIDWIVMRNRLSHIDARNKRVMAGLLDDLAKRIGFRLAPGFGERVVFRELFPKGLTLLDLREAGAGVPLNMSHVSARQELRALFKVVGLEADEAA